MTLDMLMKEMVAAMKAKDKARKDVISSLVDAIKKAAIDKNCRNNIPEDMVNTVILKERKTVQEMIDTCPAARTDLLDAYNYRMSVISEFAPKLMSEEDIRRFLVDTITNSGLTFSPKAKGSIMKMVMPLLKGKADGKLINKVLTELLNQ